LARLCFAGLWTLADKEGRLEDRPRWIKNKLLGYDDVEVNEILDELAKPRNCSPGAFILRYEVEGRNYIQIRKFDQYQNPHPKEQPSRIPPPPKGLLESREKTLLIPVSKNETGTCNALPSVPSIPSVSSVPSEKAALTSQRQPAQPAVRWEPAPKWQEDHESLGVTEFIVASEYFSQLVKDYPRLDVRAEIAKMKQYALANPSWARRKKNWRKTLTNWLNRADERFDDSRFKGGQARASPKEPKMYETLRRMKGEQIGDG
jgi:hypothetical protein